MVAPTRLAQRPMRDPETLLSVASHAPVIARLLSSPPTGARRRGEEANVRGVLTFVIVLLAIGGFGMVQGTEDVELAPLPSTRILEAD